MFSKAPFTLLKFYLTSVCVTYFALFFHTIDMSNLNVAHNLRQQCQVVEGLYSVQAWRDCILFRCILCGNYEPCSETDKNKQNVLYA